MPAALRGATLVEMLIVIAILAILAGFAVPQMQPAMESRRIREAARGLNVYFGSARNRAIATGRPCGVLIRRFDNLPGCSMVVEQVEEPLPYGGDTLSASATVQFSGSTVQATFTPPLNTSLVSAGDLVQFNYQGPFYVITDPPGGGPLSLSPVLPSADALPWPTSGNSLPMPYMIYRRPLKTAAAPYQLPAGVVVDLNFSGTGSPTDWTAFLGTGTDPVIIMFSANGAADCYYVDNTVNFVIDPIYLLVGKREKVPVTVGEENWSDFVNLWVAISPQTGLVTSAEVAAQTTPAESREFARSAQGKGGN